MSERNSKTSRKEKVDGTAAAERNDDVSGLNRETKKDLDAIDDNEYDLRETSESLEGDSEESVEAEDGKKRKIEEDGQGEKIQKSGASDTASHPSNLAAELNLEHLAQNARKEECSAEESVKRFLNNSINNENSSESFSNNNDEFKHEQSVEPSAADEVTPEEQQFSFFNKNREEIKKAFTDEDAKEKSGEDSSEDDVDGVDDNDSSEDDVDGVDGNDSSEDDVDGVDGNDSSDAENDDDDNDNARDNSNDGNVEKKKEETAEETTEEVVSGKAKLYELVGNAWEERGCGNLEVNDRKECTQFVFHIDKTYRCILNCTLSHAIPVRLENKSIVFATLVGKVAKNYCIRVKEEKDFDVLKDYIETRKKEQ